MPNISSAYRAVSMRPLVAMACGTPASREGFQQFPRAGERSNLGCETLIRLSMNGLQSLGVFRCELPSGFPQERVHEEAAAHADPAVNAPNRKFHSCVRQRFAPCENVLVNTIDQRPVQVEEERRR